MKAWTIFVGFFIGFQAHAALGGLESSVESDKVHLRALSHTQTVTSNYTAHSLQTQMNTVTEYADSKRLVFAVTWHGVVKPDLSTLLGSYFPEYDSVDRARPRMMARQPVHIQTPNIDVTKDGHMRDIRGRAYLPGRVPTGVNLWDLE